MELTQRLECTQSFSIHTERVCAEQVAFLGICGEKHPVKKGPNKIGRDPDTCNIVLNMNSISRQHAVINVLNNNEYMLMDLDSANKTKLENKTLQPYIPFPIRDGDTVQFGQIFGIFRLLEDKNDLPLTQAIDIPETPVPTRFISKINNVHTTTIPESPDVSDRDDSFIMPSQPQSKELFKSPNNHCIKSSGKTLEKQQIGMKKIDNVYWTSSKKSESLMQSNTSICGYGLPSPLQSEFKINSNDIHELNTQVLNQLDNNECTDSLFTAETQVQGNRQSLDIYEMETQVPICNNLPTVDKLQHHHNVVINEFLQNDGRIFSAKTEATGLTVHINSKETTKDDNLEIKRNTSLNTSETSNNDIIIFDEIESQAVEEFGSQPLLPFEKPQNIKLPINDGILVTEIKESLIQNVHVESDSSTDCEDIHVSQNVSEKRSNGCLTNCGDIPESGNKTSKNSDKTNEDDDVTDCEDDFDDKNVVGNIEINNFIKPDIHCEDLLTQIVNEEDVNIENKDENEILFEEMLTQVIVPDNVFDTESNINEIPQEIDSKDKLNANRSCHSHLSMTPFKVPQSPLKMKKDQKNITITKHKLSYPSKSAENVDQYYDLTQDIVNDLCSQQDVNIGHDNNRFTSPMKNSSEKKAVIDEKINTFVQSLSNKEKKGCIFTETEIPLKLKKRDSESSSDIEFTPKKNTFTLMDIELPSSQEIKSSVTLNNRNINSDLSSESETDNDSEHATPILFHHKRKKSNESKKAILKKFDINTLPSRIITRIRKPTSKALEGNKGTNGPINKFKPNFLTDQEENIDGDIITENLSRLKCTLKSHSKEKNKKGGENREDKKDNIKSNIKKIDEQSTGGNKKAKEFENISKVNNATLNTMERYVTKSNLTTTVPSPRTTRSRSKKTSDANDNPEGKSSSVKLEESINLNKNKKTKNSESHVERDLAVRRSKRQKNENGQSTENKYSKRKHHDHSTVYNESSRSNVSRTFAGKRSAEIDSEPSSSKKVKTSASSSINVNTSCSSKSSSANRGKCTQRVLFTAYPNASDLEVVKSKLEHFGAILETDVMMCTAVLTLQIKRTFKLLCAVGLGKPIVGPEWVQACEAAKRLVDPRGFILKDAATEERFRFDLKRTLSGKRNFLKGYKVSSTPKVMPVAEELKMIVECSGGTWKEGGKNWLCVSCLLDKPLWPQLRRKGAIVVSTELILGGVLRQELDIDNYRL